jgi:hypothetical protein
MTERIIRVTRSVISGPDTQAAICFLAAGPLVDLAALVSLGCGAKVDHRGELMHNDRDRHAGCADLPGAAATISCWCPPRSATPASSLSAGRGSPSPGAVPGASPPCMSPNGGAWPQHLSAGCEAVIHMSTALLIHTYLRRWPACLSNCPKSYAQHVIVAGEGAAGEHELREDPVIARRIIPPGGQEVTVTSLAC